MAERCHLEIHLEGGWHTAGELRVDDPARGMQSAASFDYDFDFLDRYAHRLGARDVHAVSCRYGLGYQAYRQESWPAFLLDIVPSGAARRTWERELELPNTSASDWPLLLRGGDNPIGNLRIREAAAASRNQVTAAHPGFARAQVLARATDFLEYVSVQPEAELRELLLRDVLDLALGNTDNHARNTAVLKHVDGTVALSPLFDFAPMFLDTQGIARVCRWRSERTGALDWHDVVRALEPHGLDAAKTLRWLAELSETVRVLPTLLHDAGLEPHVLARCAPLIERTAGSLEALR